MEATGVEVGLEGVKEVVSINEVDDAHAEAGEAEDERRDTGVADGWEASWLGCGQLSRMKDKAKGKERKGAIRRQTHR